MLCKRELERASTVIADYGENCGRRVESADRAGNYDGGSETDNKINKPI